MIIKEKMNEISIITFHFRIPNTTEKEKSRMFGISNVYFGMFAILLRRIFVF